MSKVSIQANIRAKSGQGPRPKTLTLDQAIDLLELELAALRRWYQYDPHTPYRHEAAARLLALADAIRLAK